MQKQDILALVNQRGRQLIGAQERYLYQSREDVVDATQDR